MNYNIFKGIKANTLFSSFVFMVLSRANLIITNAVIGIILARWLGATEYGKYAFIISLITLLNLPASIGIPNLILREVAFEQAKAQWGKIKGLLYWSCSSIAVLSFFIISITVVCYYYFPSEYTDKYGINIVVSLLLIPLLSFISLLNNFIRSLHYPGTSQVSSFVKQIFFIIILFVVIYYIPDFSSANATTALGINIISSFVSLLVAMTLIGLKLSKKIKISRPSYQVKKWVYSSLPFAMIMGLQIINNRADSIMLGIFRSSDEVAYYDVAMRSAELILFLPIAFNMAIAPTLSRFYSEGLMNESALLIKKAVRMLVFLSVPMLLIFIFYGYEIILFVFGKEYTAAEQAFYILMYANCINLLTGPCDLVLNMCKKERVTLRGVGMAAILNVVLNYYLIPLYGIEGACTATAITTVVWNLSLLYLARLHTGIDTSVIGMKYRNTH